MCTLKNKTKRKRKAFAKYTNKKLKNRKKGKSGKKCAKNVVLNSTLMLGCCLGARADMSGIQLMAQVAFCQAVWAKFVRVKLFVRPRKSA